MIIAYKNAVYDYTITATTELPNQPATNLQDNRLSRKWHSAIGGTNYLTLSDSFALDCVIVKDHNIALTDTVTLEGAADNTFASLTTEEEIEVIAGGFALFIDAATKYWRLKIESADSVYIGGLYMGTSTELPDYELTYNVVYNTADVERLSDSGQLYGDKMYNYRVGAFIFPWVVREVDDVVLLDLWETHTTIRPFYVVQFPDKISHYPVWYCKLEKTCCDFTGDNANAQIYSNVGFNIREVF